MGALWGAGAIVRAYDPEACGEAKRIYGDRPELILCDTPREAVVGADALVVVTEWKAFRSPDFAELAALLSAKVLFDGRNLYDPKVLAEAGLEYYGIGRGRSLWRDIVA
jgi:UDPglucose 6-dehydrogenase